MLYCEWWEKTLEEIEEDASECCLHEGRTCTICPYIDEKENNDNQNAENHSA